MQTPHVFRYCPRCGAAADHAGNPFRCAACGLSYYFNAAAAVAALIAREDGRVLFIRRANDPARGRLALPGGFVDIGEPVERALRREVREEVNLELGALQFLVSHPNSYEYAGVTYATVDLFFVTRALDATVVRALDAVAEVGWHDAARMDLDDLAFESMREAMRCFRRSPASGAM